jgi:hypothetical protein
MKPSLQCARQHIEADVYGAAAVPVQVLFVRLLFLSVLVMAIYTLLEADKRPDVADVVAGEPQTQTVEDQTKKEQV